MIVTCFGQEPESTLWWKLVREGAESLKELPLHRRFSPHATKEEATLVVEGARPDDATWVSRDELPREIFAPHPLRVPWGFPGWLELALAWIAAHADGLHSWKEIKSWSLSCVIRAETGRGVVYFKATNQQPKLFANEALVTQNLAVRFPGRSDDGVPVWLPIDAKFPREDYERLLEAHDRADATAADAAARALEGRIRQEAKAICESYVSPPHTTDFAILFLPVESLYAEVLRRPGVMDALQRDYRVTLAGPTTLLAMLNSLHMGFRTLALQEQASEVWKVLGAVKTEFERYGDWVVRIKDQVQKAADTLDKADTRARQMRRALKGVEALPEAQAQALLPSADDPHDDPET